MKIFHYLLLFIFFLHSIDYTIACQGKHLLYEQNNITFIVVVPLYPIAEWQFYPAMCDFAKLLTRCHFESTKGQRFNAHAQFLCKHMFHSHPQSHPIPKWDGTEDE